MGLKYPFDPRTQVNVDQALWHHDPNLEALVRDIFERYKPDCFVETGTHMGWTAHWVATNYPDVQVHTVEVDRDFYATAWQNLEGLPNAHIELDDSVNFLWKLRTQLLNARPLFWLDAHWHPPVPLREECRIVAGLPRYVCLIDDFQCWGPDFGGDTFYTRKSDDYTLSGIAGGGDKYHNDLSYVWEAFIAGSRARLHAGHPQMWGRLDHYRPNYEAQPGNNGVGCFVYREEAPGFQLGPTRPLYEPPATWRAESVKQFLATRPASAYPLHPSFEVVR